MSEIEMEAAAWAARLDRGLTAEEEAALHAWLTAHPFHRGALLRYQAAMSLLDRGRALNGATEQQSPEPTRPAMHHRRAFLRVGGGFAVALVGGVTWRLVARPHRIATAVGEIRHVPLEDGSVAVVNSASTLRVAYHAGRRDISLADGEAWFKVAKNRTRPFTVSAGPAIARAVGTAFDVRRRLESTEILVTEGTVEVWPVGRREQSRLVPAGHRVIVGRDGSIDGRTIETTVADQRLAWREGRIVLDNMNLANAVHEFNRYHVVQLEVDAELLDHKVVGWFSTDDLNGFADATAMIVGGRVERDGKTIRIKK